MPHVSAGWGRAQSRGSTKAAPAPLTHPRHLASGGPDAGPMGLHPFRVRGARSVAGHRVARMLIDSRSASVTPNLRRNPVRSTDAYVLQLADQADLDGLRAIPRGPERRAAAWAALRSHADRTQRP